MADIKPSFQYGLALSGGVTRCFAQIGVLQALEEKGIRPGIISAVSAGAIIGALYADGHTPRQILEELTSNRLMSYLRFSLRRRGIVQMAGFEKILRGLLSTNRLEELKIPLLVFAVNLNTAQFTCFEKGELVKTVVASSSLPVIFPPVKIGPHYFVDGGVINNFPVDPLVGRCRTLIGVNVNPIGPVEKVGGPMKIFGRVYRILVRSHNLGRDVQCNYLIEPRELIGHGLMEMSKAHELFEIGYNDAIRVLKDHLPVSGQANAQA